MELVNGVEYIANLATVISALAVAIFFARSKIMSDTIKNQRELIDTLEENRLQDKAAFNQKIGELSDKIQTMAGSLEVLTKENTTLSGIMKDALVMYFEKHPKKAATLEAEVR